jgi:hypothetical protein
MHTRLNAMWASYTTPWDTTHDLGHWFWGVTGSDFAWAARSWKVWGPSVPGRSLGLLPRLAGKKRAKLLHNQHAATSGLQFCPVASSGGTSVRKRGASIVAARFS